MTHCSALKKESNNKDKNFVASLKFDFSLNLRL